MFEFFSISAKLAVFWARVEAGRLGSEAIELQQLLLGVMTEDQGESLSRARQLLGPDTIATQIADRKRPFFSSEEEDRLRQSILDSITVEEPRPDSEDIPLSEEAGLALVTAKSHTGNSDVDIIQILWGMLSCENSPTGRLLASIGVTRHRIEEFLG